MSLVFIKHFIYDSTSYDCYFDTGDGSCSVVVTGPTPHADIPFPNDGDGASVGDLAKEFCSDNPDTTLVDVYVQSHTPFINAVLTPDSPSCPVGGGGGGCDLGINTIVVTNETDTGANDGTITVNASSSNPPIEYSIDGTTYQTSNFFEGIAPGNYTLYIRDALDGCHITSSFTILAFVNPVQSFTDDLPVLSVGGNLSKWNAVFNPIVANFQRKDYVITSITHASPTQIKVVLSTPLTFDQYSDGIANGIAFKSDKYDFIGTPDSYSGGFLITTPYLGDDTSGYLNVINQKPSYKIQIELTTGLDPVFKTITLVEFSSDAKGFTRADLSTYLQTFLSAKETYDFITANYRDYNLAGSFTMRYRELWFVGNGPWFSAPYPMYYTFAAMQLGELYGGNMAAYVPFQSVTLAKFRAKFLTGFTSPTRWQGLPFEISFIYSEDIIDKELFLELTPNCGSVTNGLLLNADASYLLDADSSRFIIQRVFNPDIEGYPVIAQLGVNRVLIPDVFDCCADKIVANLYYMDGEAKVYVMQPLTINQDCGDGCLTDKYVYLKWINSRGAWDYWRFGHNQTYGGTTQNSQQVVRYVQNWQDDQTIEDFISRNANKKIGLVAGALNQDQFNALQWMTNSVKVQMLTSLNPVKWQTVIIPDGDMNAYDSKKPTGNFKINIVLPGTNIQRQ